MSKQTSNRSTGNDGTWFLEAIGAAPRPASSTEAVAELEAENTMHDELAAVAVGADDADVTVDLSSFDGDPGTSTSSFHPAPAPPPPPAGIAVEAPPPEVQEQPALPAEEPVDIALEPVVRSRRNFRWPIVLVLLLAIGAVVAAAIWLPIAARDEAQAVRIEYYDAAFAVRDHLPATQSALDAITDPSAESSDVAGSVPIIAELDTRAFALEDVMAEPLPTTLPLVPTAEIDALEPLQDRGAVLGAASSDLARRLGNAYVYRTSMPLLLDLGDLPSSASTEQINALAVRIASTLAADAGIVADLPGDPSFVDVKASAQVALDRATVWQDEYLAALSDTDADTATVLVTEMEGIVADLGSLTVDALIAFRGEADVLIVELAADFDVYLNALVT